MLVPKIRPLRSCSTDSQIATKPAASPQRASDSTKLQWFLVSVILFVVIVISLLIARFSPASGLATISILLVSLIRFHSVAVLTADCTRLWRCEGYPLALTGFMAIPTALAGIQENARLAPLNAAVADRKITYDALIYSLNAVIENDCHPKASPALRYLPSPEPYAGA